MAALLLREQTPWDHMEYEVGNDETTVAADGIQQPISHTIRDYNKIFRSSDRHHPSS